MVGIVRTIKPEKEMRFDDILSFETNNFIGIYDHGHCGFTLIAKQDEEFSSMKIEYASDLEDLDNQVFASCEEHIIGVSRNNAYKLILTKD